VAPAGWLPAIMAMFPPETGGGAMKAPAPALSVIPALGSCPVRTGALLLTGWGHNKVRERLATSRSGLNRLVGLDWLSGATQTMGLV
jgi:hypothetical protein